MSFQAMTWATGQNLPAMQKIVLLMMANRTNPDTGLCFPSHELLAKDCGMSKRSMVDQINKLETQGLIQVFRTKNNKGLNNVNRYRLNLSFYLKEDSDSKVGSATDALGSLIKADISSNIGSAGDAPYNSGSAGYAPHSAGDALRSSAGDAPETVTNETVKETTTTPTPSEPEPKKNEPEENVVGVVVEEKSLEPENTNAEEIAVMAWATYFMNVLGYRLHEAQTPKTMPMFRDWVRQGVEMLDLQTAMIKAHHCCGDVARLDSPAGYKKFVATVMANKLNYEPGAVQPDKPKKADPNKPIVPLWTGHKPSPKVNNDKYFAFLEKQYGKTGHAKAN